MGAARAGGPPAGRGDPRRPAEATLHPAQLPRAGAHALPAGGHPARAAAVLHRAQLGRPAFRPRHPQLDLPAREGRQDRAAVRDRARRRRAGLRVPRALHGARADRERAPARAHRRTPLCQALRHGADERLGDELRCAVRQRARGAQPWRGDGRVRPRHRRGRALEVPPPGRGPRVGDRQRLLRRPHRRRRLRPAQVRRHGGRRPGADGLAEAQPGRQAGHRRRPAGRQGHPGDRGGTGGAEGGEVRLPACSPGLLDAARARAVHRPHARALRREAGRVQAVPGLPLGLPRRSARRWWPRGWLRTS